MITFSVVIYSTYTPSFQALLSNVFIVILAFILAIVPLVYLVANKLTRTVPVNYLMLLVFTIGESGVASFICSYYTADSVIFALIFFGITTVTLVMASLLMRSMENYACLMIGALLLGIAFQLSSIFFGLITLNYDTYLVLEGIGGSIIYGVYVVIDLKIIEGSVPVDDYILGAVMLYSDLLLLFLKILQAVGSRK